MGNSLRASAVGLALVDQARQRRGWTKTSTARWWQDAHTSRATLRRFWQGDRIQREIFIAICNVVGLADWEAVATHADLSDVSTPWIDWNEAPDLEYFYGRSQELNQLEQRIVSDRCKLVAICGLAGTGKTAVALALADQIQSHFECLIWKSLHNVPSLVDLLDRVLYNLSGTVTETLQQGITQLIDHLQKRRCLLVLDGLETVLTRQNAKEYSGFLQQLSRDRHQSCVLITSREKPNAPEWSLQTVHHLSLKGLQPLDALELLKAGGLTGKPLSLFALSQLYRGNPLALRVAMPLIQTGFGGDVAAFLNQNTLVMGDRLRTILQESLNHLSDLEQEILYWLAIWQEPVAFCRLQTHLLISPDPTLVLEGLAALERRSLLERYFMGDQPAFTLQPLIKKVVTNSLVEQAAQEIMQAVQNQEVTGFKVLRTHWMLRPGTDDLTGDCILTQLREKLWNLYHTDFPKNLNQILEQLQQLTPLAVGYTGSNLMALLRF